MSTREEKRRARNLKKLQKYEDKLSKFQALIPRYKAAFLADDGIIDSKEQRKLDKIDRRVRKALAKVNKMKDKLQLSPNPDDLSVGNVITPPVEDKHDDHNHDHDHDGHDHQVLDAVEIKAVEDLPTGEIEQAVFNAGNYSKVNHVPASKGGLFDIELNPTTGILKITLKVKFTFIKGDKVVFDTLEGQDPLWTDIEKKEWREGYLGLVREAWDGKYNFIHPDLKDYEVAVDVDVQEVESKWHYDLRITKIKKGGFQGSSVSHYKDAEKKALAQTDRHYSRLDSEDLNAIDKGGSEKQTAAVHESGHMLGLGDEYRDGRAGITHAAMVKDALGTVLEEGRHDNVMSVGNHIGKQHYVTFLDALKAVTELENWTFKK
jgi:hypothetical protein